MNGETEEKKSNVFVDTKYVEFLDEPQGCLGFE